MVVQAFIAESVINALRERILDPLGRLDEGQRDTVGMRHCDPDPVPSILDYYRGDGS